MDAAGGLIKNKPPPACCPMDDWDHFESLKEKIGMPFP